MLLTFILIGCQESETPRQAESFLDQVTNMWWHPENSDNFLSAENFYLEREDSYDYGNIWLDFDFGPADPIDDNTLGGTWKYVGDRKFDVVYKDGTECGVKVEESEDNPGCYIMTCFFYKDLACPLFEE